jgi:hypothetical protein
MKKQLLKLEKLINSAAWVCSIRAPKGVNAESWDKSIEDLFAANQLIKKINNKGE